MRFFFDNNLSPKLPYILRILRVDAVHLRSHFKKDTPDADWLPEVGRRGWVVVTRDARIRRQPAERTLLSRHRITCVFLRGLPARRGPMYSVEWVLHRWPDIVSEVGGSRQGTWLDVPQRGKIKRIT